MAKHQYIFTASKHLYERQESGDLVSVADELLAMGKLDAAGGRGELIDLLANVATAANTAHHAKIIRGYSIRRKLIVVGTETATLAADETESVENLIEYTEEKIFDIQTHKDARRAVALGDVVGPVLERAKDLRNNPKKAPGLMTGFPDFDRMTGGLDPGTMFVLAARPSMGKTALALKIALNVARYGTPVGFFTIESTVDQLTKRMICMDAQIDSNHFKTGRFNGFELQRAEATAVDLGKMPIYFDDNEVVTPLLLRSRARRLKMQRKIGLIVVDYLQLMRIPGISKPVDEVSRVSNELRALAKNIGVPLIAISQLSRIREGEKNKRPQLSDLRMSGNIEQDADIVAFLYREEYYTGKNKGEAELIVKKQKDGPTGVVDLRFVGKHTLFQSVAQEGQSELSV